MKPNNCLIIGITGGIASGKSTVSSLLMDKGYKVIDADRISREVVEIGKPAYIEILEYFGSRILNEDKTINRKKLGKIIFSNDNDRATLNRITHPYIFKLIKEEMDKYCKSEKIIFIDIPLLFEEINKYKEYNINFDEVWLIYIDEETQLKRLIKRDSLDEMEGIKRIKAQLSMEKKRNLATRIIDNMGDLSTLKDNLNISLSEIE